MPARDRWILAITASMTLAGCSCIENALFGKPEQLAPPPEALPGLFAPLRWDTPEDRLPPLFPKTRLEEGPWFGEPFWRWYRSRTVEAEIPGFGRAEVEIQFVRPGHGEGAPTIAAVTARRHDPRLECPPRAPPPPRRPTPPPALGELFARVQGAVEKEYGRGSPAADVTPEWREVAWQRDGFTLSVRLHPDEGCSPESDEDDVWVLELAAETERVF